MFHHCVSLQLLLSENSDFDSKGTKNSLLLTFYIRDRTGVNV
jgi:hypothetical protein